MNNRVNKWSRLLVYAALGRLVAAVGTLLANVTLGVTLGTIRIALLMGLTASLQAADIVPKPHSGNQIIPTHVQGRRSIVSQKKNGTIVVTPFPSDGPTAYVLIVTEGAPGNLVAKRNGASFPVWFADQPHGMLVVPTGATAPFTLYIDYKGEQHTFPFGLKEEL